MADQGNKMSSAMQERLNLSRKVTAPPLNDFDDSDAVPGPSARALMQIQPAGLHKDVILISLLKGWCEANGKSASKRQRLYKKMFRKLQENEFISPAHIEALKQCNYNVLLKTLVSWSLSSSSGDSPDGRALVPYTPFMLPPDEDQSNFFQQRYKKDFIEKERIGEGGFGKVYKAQHKLDKEHYAVKKIKVTKKKSCSYQSMQREIQTLACLNHRNVVRYHQSWFGEEFHEVSEQSQNKLLMLGFRSTHDMEDSEGEEDDDSDDDSDGDSNYDDNDNNDGSDEEEEEPDEIEIDGEDPLCPKLMKGSSDEKRSGINKPVPTSPVITEVIETKREQHSQLTSIAVSRKGTEVDPFNPEFSVPFEDERFDSGELVNDFFTQTTENVASIKPLVSTREEEEFSNIQFNESTKEIMQEIDRVTDDDARTESWESSGTSSSTVVFQNPESEDTECDNLYLPSLKEQNSTRVKFMKQSHQVEQCTKTSLQTDCDIKITAKSKSKKIVKSTIIPVTSATAAILSTFTSSLTSSTHVRSKTQYTPSRSQRRSRNGRFSRSISWDGQESSPEVNTGYWSLPRPLAKRRYYLYIQMELCCSTLRRWLTERNDAVATTENQFDVVSERQNQDIYKQILEGMHYIHTQGILHRDVTPKNIFLSDKEGDHLHVKIGDFGLAREDVLTEPKTPMRFQRDQDLQEYSVDPCASQTYTSNIGTETYAAPEQLDGTTYDNKSDMYSLGLILFELYHPFGTGMERYKCLDNLRKGSVPEELWKRWPAQYTAIRRLTRQDSRERPSASDLLAGDMFPSKDKVIERQAGEIERLRKLLAEKETEISQLKESRSRKM